MAKWIGPLAVAALVMATTGACGSNDEPKTKEAKTETIDVRGSVRVDALGGVTYAKDGTCSFAGPDDSLGDGKELVVIADPSGKELAALNQVDTTTETYDDKGETYASPGICLLNFVGKVTVPKGETGVFKATVPALDAEKRFSLSDAGSIVIEWSAR